MRCISISSEWSIGFSHDSDMWVSVMLAHGAHIWGLNMMGLMVLAYGVCDLHNMVVEYGSHGA